MLLMSVQPPISTIPRKTLYLLANPVLCFDMFASKAASLPQPTRRHLANRSPLPRPFHSNRCHPACPVRSRRERSEGSAFLSLLAARHSPLAAAPLTPFLATLTAPPQLTENTAALNPSSANVDAASSLTPLFATLTKNTRGWGRPLQSGSLSTDPSLMRSAPRYYMQSFSPFGFQLSTVNRPPQPPSKRRLHDAHLPKMLKYSQGATRFRRKLSRPEGMPGPTCPQLGGN